MTKILCAVDDTPASATAARLAGKIAGALGAELTVLAVNQIMGASKKLLWDGAMVQRILTAGAEEARTAGASSVATRSVNSPDPAEGVTQLAESEGFDHIVVGCGGKGAVFRMVLGSVSREIIQRAKCSVTIAR